MRGRVLALLGAALCALAGGLTTAAAAGTEALAGAPASHGAIARQIASVSDTVRVQLAVFGAVIFVVVIVGLIVYAVRKRLGLVPPPPDQPAGGHH